MKKVTFWEKLSVVIFLISKFYKNVWDMRTQQLLEREKIYSKKKESMFDIICDEGDKYLD